jgi:predicted PurR-regulated permease PerM
VPVELRLSGVVQAVALVLMVGWILHIGRPILVPVFAAVLIVFVIGGLSSLLGKLPRLSRLPVWSREVLAALIICGAIFELVALVAVNVGAFAARAPVYQEALLTLYQRVAVQFDFDEAATLRAIRAEAARAIDLPGLARAAAGSAAGVVAVLAFVLLNVGFLMTERKAFGIKLDRLGLAAESRARAEAVATDVHERVGAYLAMKTLMNLVLGGLSWLIMVIFGVEFAAVFAIIIAVLNYIPYFGSFVGVTLPVAAALVTFPEPAMVFWLAFWLAAAQILIGNVIEPQAMGSSLNLSPWVILIALTVWGALWGVAGAVFSVPITAVMVVVLSEFERTRAIAILMSRDGDLGTPRGGVAPSVEAP